LSIWSPPDALDRRAGTVLAALAGLAVALGYASTLLTQTITYAAKEFHAGTAGQGVALASVRTDILLALVMVRAADRRGRRSVIIGAAAAGCVLTSLGAASPNLAWLAASQALGRSFITAATIVAGVLVAESVPKGARAWSAGVIAMATAVGAGICVVSLPVTGVGVQGWRLLYAACLVWLLVVWIVARHLPESERFEHRVHGTDRTWGPRLKLLASAAFLFQMFITPAAQFQNEYLRHHRGFSASRIALFTVITAVPGAIGIVLGGRLADVRGRRGVAIVAVGGVTLAGVASYSVRGWPMWVSATTAAITGAAVIPALSVYGPELFSTDHRSAANGWIAAAGRVGSVLGLLAVGGITQLTGTFSPGFAVVAIGPIALMVLVYRSFPETARRSLEELNPADAGGLS